MVCIRRQWTCDTQENEGANNVVQSLVEASPNISLPLLSSRLTIKKRLRIIASSIQQRDHISDRKAMRAAVDVLIQECMDYYERANDVLGESSRFCDAEPVDIPPSIPEAPKITHTPASIFAGKYHGSWSRACGQPVYHVCFGFTTNELTLLLLGDVVWLCFVKHRSVGMTFRAN